MKTILCPHCKGEIKLTATGDKQLQVAKGITPVKPVPIDDDTNPILAAIMGNDDEDN